MTSAKRTRSFLPLIVLAVGLVWTAGAFRKPVSKPGEFDLESFGRLPALVNGRIKPLDSVARNSLMIMQSKQSLRLEDGTRLPAIRWLADLLFNRKVADASPTFRIMNAEVLGMFGWQPHGRKNFSFSELEPFLEKIDEQGQQAEQVESAQRSAYQTAILNLRNALVLYQRLSVSIGLQPTSGLVDELSAYEKSIEPGFAAVRAQQAGGTFDEDALRELGNFVSRYEASANLAYIRPVPPAMSGAEWMPVGGSLINAVRAGKIDPVVTGYAALADAWRNQDVETFNRQLSDLTRALSGSDALKRSTFEAYFNHVEPFYVSMVLYVGAVLLAFAYWLRETEGLRRGGWYLLAIGLAVHTFGLIARMYLQGRPPVTNLYSSAIFIGWGTVILGMILERFYRDGIGVVCAGLIGFVTLIIAHHLSGTGDTLEMLRAVLDTNIWLATHVVVITIGYAAMFLAGTLALLYILRGVFTQSLDEGSARSLSRMVYGVVCFATLFSFVGTVLGGIWADQSWGRFWGWDPKENGALLIVLWCALILHARWGGYIRQRGLMVMAVFGNVVTSFSWFGVNMLGVGLHSYGFMDKAFWWLTGFMISQLAMMGVAAIPLSKWRSFRAITPEGSAAPVFAEREATRVSAS